MTKELLLEISYNCNFRCIHCSSIGCPDKIELSELDRFRFVIDEIDSVRISGGEALLNNDLIDYVDHFYDRGVKVILQTNGLLEIPPDIYNKLHKIYLSLYSNYERQTFITGNVFSYDACIERIEQHSNVVLCSPIFSLSDSLNLIAMASKYDLPVRFTSLLNHGRCDFALPMKEQFKIYNLICNEWNKIIPHCSLMDGCDIEKKWVLRPDLSLIKCASNKQGKKACKKYTE